MSILLRTNIGGSASSRPHCCRAEVNGDEDYEEYTLYRLHNPAHYQMHSVLPHRVALSVTWDLPPDNNRGIRARFHSAANDEWAGSTGDSTTQAQAGVLTADGKGETKDSFPCLASYSTLENRQ